MEAHTMAYELSAQEKLEIFGSWEPPVNYAQELGRYRGGQPAPSWMTPPESKQGWQAVEDHRRRFVEQLQALIEAGVPPHDDETAAVVEGYRHSPMGTMPHEQMVMIA